MKKGKLIGGTLVLGALFCGISTFASTLDVFPFLWKPADGPRILIKYHYSSAEGTKEIWFYNIDSPESKSGPFQKIKPAAPWDSINYKTMQNGNSFTMVASLDKTGYNILHFVYSPTTKTITYDSLRIPYNGPLNVHKSPPNVIKNSPAI